MKTAILYCRKSTSNSQTQQNSLNVQETILRRFAASNDCKVGAIYYEEASGRCDKRPVFKQALQRAIADDAYLLVFRLDRLSRSYRFFSQIVDHIHRLRTPQMGWRELDPFICNLMISIACNESAVLSQRIKATFAVLKENNPDFKVGNPRIMETAYPASLKARTANATEFNTKIQSLLTELDELGYKTLKQKADRLNYLGITTRRNKQWVESSVWRVERYRPAV